MFFISSQINIYGYHLPTFAFFLILGILSWFFVIWYEGRRDGFDDERMLDLSLASFTLGTLAYIFTNNQINWLKIYQPYSPFLLVDSSLTLCLAVLLASILPVLLLGKLWSWSSFRLLDIYASAYSQMGFYLCLGTYFVYKTVYLMPLIVMLPTIYFLILRFRGSKIPSGVVFSLFLLLIIPHLLLFYKAAGHLLFVGILTTISFINFYFRWRTYYVNKTTAKGVFGRAKA